MAAKATPTLTSVTINYNSGIKANLEKLGKEYKYENLTVMDSESRTYNVEGMPEIEVDEFIAATRQVMKDRIDQYVQDGYNEIFE